MKTKASLEPGLHWTEHFVKYGFAVLERLVEKDFIDEALTEVKRLVGSSLPLEEWTQENITSRNGIVIPAATNNPVLSRVYDQPGLRAAMGEMFGAPDKFSSDERCWQLFVTPYDPGAKRTLAPDGHIDYVNKPIPVLGRGFVFQVSLVDKEPFGGNITVWPGTHKAVLQAIKDNPGWRYPTNWSEIPRGQPFEFVAEAGDAFFFHHLIAHSGNANCTRMPRISLHCQAWQDEWLTEIDPTAPNLSPWQRSFAHNGPYHIRPDEQIMREEDARQRSHTIRTGPLNGDS